MTTATAEQPIETAVNEHVKLRKLLRRAHSGEKAAALAYVGHAASTKDPAERALIKQIEVDEWDHRAEVLSIMNRHGVPVSRFNEVKFFLIGRVVSLLCYGIGRFLRTYFAGKIESGNVGEYFRLIEYFDELGITEHHSSLRAMAIKEKEHEHALFDQIRSNRALPVFERVFGWGEVRVFKELPLPKP